MLARVKARHGQAAVTGLLLLAATVSREASRMPAGTVALPGPGFFPLGLATLLGATAIGLLLQILLRPGPDAEPVSLGHRHIATALLALTAVAILLERLGFLITMSAFLFVQFRAFANLGWLQAVAAAAATAGGAYLFFQTILGVPLPGSPW